MPVFAVIAVLALTMATIGVLAGATQCSFGGARLWHTTDAGASWQQIVLVDPQHEVSHGIRFEQCKEFISFADSTHGFVDAWDDNGPPTIYHTSDGGANWEAGRLPDPPGFKTSAGGDALRADPVRIFGATLLVAASGMQPDGLHNYVFRSTDGGATWSYLAGTSRPVVLVSASRWLRASRHRAHGERRARLDIAQNARTGPIRIIVSCRFGWWGSTATTRFGTASPISRSRRPNSET